MCPYVDANAEKGDVRRDYNKSGLAAQRSPLIHSLRLTSARRTR